MTEPDKRCPKCGAACYASIAGQQTVWGCGTTQTADGISQSWVCRADERGNALRRIAVALGIPPDSKPEEIAVIVDEKAKTKRRKK